MRQMIAEMFIIMTLAFEVVALFGGAIATAFIVSIIAAAAFETVSYFANKNTKVIKTQVNEQEKLAA